MTVKIAVTLGLMILASLAKAEGDPCYGGDPMLRLVNSSKVLALCAASGKFRGADSVCTATLGGDWKTEEPSWLAGCTPEAQLESGLNWLRTAVEALQKNDRASTVADLESWVMAYRVVETLAELAGSEELATAVAFIPSLADLIPRDEALRSTLGRNIGGSLASAEHTELHYALAGRLAGLSLEERALVIHDLWIQMMGP